MKKNREFSALSNTWVSSAFEKEQEFLLTENIKFAIHETTLLQFCVRQQRF